MDPPLQIQTLAGLLSQVVFPILLQTSEQEKEALRLQDNFPVHEEPQISLYAISI